MGIITPDRIAELIADAPAWTLVGLTVQKEALRDAARHELAQHVYTALYRSTPTDGATQLALPLA